MMFLFSPTHLLIIVLTIILSCAVIELTITTLLNSGSKYLKQWAIDSNVLTEYDFFSRREQ